MSGSRALERGRVVFVGAGPGAADLITLRGVQRLALAEVVLFDALTDPALRAFAPQAQWVDVGKRGFGSDATAQGAIDALLVEHALAGRRVVRLKGGDPSLFGRLEEELQALASSGIGYEVVPGITAATAAAADTARPLTRRGRGRSVTLATAMTRERRLDVATVARQDGAAADRPAGADTAVYYMAGRQLAALGPRLIAAGWPADSRVCVVSRAGWPDSLCSEHVLHALADAACLHAGRPAVVTVGAGAAPVEALPSGGAGVAVADASRSPAAEEARVTGPTGSPP